jgi:lysozyme family protein
MATSVITLEALSDEYISDFNQCSINKEREAEVKRNAERIAKLRSRYESVGNALNIPWYFIGLIHTMESSCNFNTHLHNGDPLTARTVQVPKGRPVSGNPPFTWEASAADALMMKRIHLQKDWSLPSLLFTMEGYNGFGYRRNGQGVKSPYLWSYTSIYKSGKYVMDGKFDINAVSKQCGTVAMLKQLFADNTVNQSELDGFFVPQEKHIALESATAGRAIVRVDALNIRAGAGTGFNSVSQPLSRGTKLEITDQNGKWRKVKAEVIVEGWVNADFIEQIS